MRRLRRFITVPAIACLLLLGGGQALAGPEWCDDGSPVPNDFRFRPTGSGSVGSSTSWLSSTTSGTLNLATGVNTLAGGVAHGMEEAIEHARPYYTLPSAEHEHEHD